MALKRCYRSDINQLNNDFFIPVLRHSVKYDRGTGYFSVGSLSLMAKGIIPFVANGGRIRIVTSVELGQEECSIITSGGSIDKSIAENLVQKRISEEKTSEEQQLDLDLITNLIASEIIEIRIAYMPSGGIYHEKIGFAQDSSGNMVYFNGSVNATMNAINKNQESMMVMESWKGDEKEIETEHSYYERLWDDNVDGIQVFKFTEALKLELFDKYKKSPTIDKAIDRYNLESNSNTRKKLLSYQELAIQEFMANNNRHFFNMATGTGKTFTAIKAMLRIRGFEDSLITFIVVPQIDLQSQWESELNENGIETYLIGGNATDDYSSVLDDAVLSYFSSHKIVAVVAVYDSFFTKAICKIKTLKLNSMIIVDEAHWLSSNQIDLLPINIDYRLGLSATPDRYNEKETEKILTYFTNDKVTPYTYSIEDAIDNGYLSKYVYHPIIVHITQQEFSKYKSYTKKIGYELNSDFPDMQKVSDYANMRSLFVKKAENKLLELDEMIDSGYDFVNAVVYCGQGKDNEFGDRIIDKVTQILSTKYRVSQYASSTDDRCKVLQEFENGYYDTLVAIKCFDQGIDVPKLDKIYIMASDNNIRQTIQRRGRVLRQCKSTGKSIAYIYDFVVMPPEGVSYDVGVQSLVHNELKRVIEYGRLSENKGDINKFVNDIVSEYSIDMDMEEEYGEARDN